MSEPPKTVQTIISKISAPEIAEDAALVVVHGPGLELGAKHKLDKARILIGRAAGADIHIDQESISRSHACIYSQPDGIFIDDLGSTNGTYVNDERIRGERSLRSGDLIKVGRTLFKFIAGFDLEALYREEIYRLAHLDGLTQVFNRRYFDEAIEREVSRALRYGRSLSLVMLDVDHLRVINETQGELAGDHVLSHLARTLKPRIRREDVFARYGGEELALILPEMEVEGAIQVAEKVRRIVERESFVFEGHPLGVTVSAGVASLGATVRNGSELVRTADAMLFEAKASGRNCVCS